MSMNAFVDFIKLMKIISLFSYILRLLQYDKNKIHMRISCLTRNAGNKLTPAWCCCSSLFDYAAAAAAHFLSNIQ